MLKVLPCTQPIATAVLDCADNAIDQHKKRRNERGDNHHDKPEIVARSVLLSKDLRSSKVTWNGF
jgi:hypothetical protein